MQISHLSLSNIRNYSRLEFEIPTGTILLYGANAQGKTNILESIYYLATTRSPFSEHDSQLINWHATQNEDPVVVGRIKASLKSDVHSHEIEVRLIQEMKNASFRKQKSFRREVLFDKRKVRLMDLIGNLRIVMFLPSDIQLITGSPAERRRFLNVTLCQIDPIYCRTLSNYNKVLEQRNALLRQIGEGLAKRDLLPVYSEKLVQYGSLIFMRRAAFLDFMTRKAQQIHYESLTGGSETIRIIYSPRLVSKSDLALMDSPTHFHDWMMKNQMEETAVSQKFHSALTSLYEHDIARGSTSIGPHRDDWQIHLNQHPLAPYGSRGQQRSAILALKMAEIEWMHHKTGEKPILLLDEVVAELDEYRRASLLNTVLESNQAILTATDPGMFTKEFLDKAHCFQVENGRIQQMSNQF